MNLFRQYVLSGQARSIRAKKHIIANFILKGVSILIGLLLIPMTIDYVDSTQYGIWITIQSIVAWFDIFNLGIGNGIRNKFATALALKDEKLARNIVSTGYLILTFFAIVFFLVVFCVNHIIDWSNILNIEITYKVELRNLSNVIFLMFFLQLILKLINSLLLGNQKAAIPSLIFLIGNIFSLILIKTLTLTTTGNLLFLAIALMGSTNLSLLAANIYFFNTSFKNYSPKIKYFDRDYVKDIIRVSSQFLGLQIVGLLLYLTSNLLISHFYGPAEVTNYNISYRYFSIILVLFTIISTPFWSAFTEAKVNHDMLWINKATKSLLIVFCILCILGLFMLLSSGLIFKLWLSDRVHISFSMRLLTFIYILLFMWNSLYGTLLNGLEALRIQIVIGVASIIVLYSLIYIFKNLGFGIEGILLGLCISQMINGVVYPIVYNKTLKKVALNVNKEVY